MQIDIVNLFKLMLQEPARLRSKMEKGMRLSIR